MPPVPEARDSSRRQNFSKTAPIFSGGMVSPRLLTATLTPSGVFQALTVTSVPASL